MAKPPAGRPWTTPADVRESVRKRWPALLAAFAAGQEWVPLGIPLRGPGPAEVGARLADVQAWAGEWAKVAARGLLRVEYKQVGGRLVGTNQIPARAWLDGYDQAWELLGARGEVRRLGELLARTKAECPRLVSWVERRPVKAVELAEDWPSLLATVRWIDERQLPGMYLRQVDVPGVDTKFIGRHRGVLAELLDVQLDQSRISAQSPDFETRYGFRRKPDYVRYRLGAPSAGRTELTVRADEFGAPPPGVTHACVVENEITYLAFPLAADAIVIFGGGYAVSVLESLAWLASIDLAYWGDLDTHGFAILNRLRHRFPAARSLLMDRATLLAHRSQWVTEPSPTNAALDLLTPAEQALYQDLVGNAYAASVRLEQERISFAALTAAVSGDASRAASTDPEIPLNGGAGAIPCERLPQ